MTSRDDHKKTVDSQSDPPNSDSLDGRSQHRSCPEQTDIPVEYLKEVEKAFSPNQRTKYELFLEILKDLKEERTETRDIAARVKELLNGHDKLIIGFNAFLPYEDKLIVDQALKDKLGDQYEGAFLKREDDRWDLDSVLDDVSSTIKATGDLLDSIKALKLESINIVPRIEKYLTETHLACINLFYGSPDYLDILETDLVMGLDYIIEGMKDRQTELSKCRSQFNMIWGEIYGDEAVLFTSQFDEQHIARNYIEYDYSDFDIHEELYKIVQCDVEKTYTRKEVIAKKMTFCSTFLHLLFGMLDAERNHSRVFFGNDAFCQLFWIYGALYGIVSSDRTNSKKPGVTNLYTDIMALILDVVSGSVDHIMFADTIRSLFRDQSYRLFIWDKLAYRLILQLAIVTDKDINLKLIELFHHENCLTHGGSIEHIYFATVRALLQWNAIYRFEFMYAPYRLFIHPIDDAAYREPSEKQKCLVLDK